MSNFLIRDLNLISNPLKQLDALESSYNILSNERIGNTALNLQSAGKDLLTGRQVAPQNPAQAVQLFKDNIFGKARDKFTYRSTFGTPVRNFLLIKGESVRQVQKDPNSGFDKEGTKLSSYRVKYENVGDKIPNTWRNLYSSNEENSFPAIFMDSALVDVSMKKNIVQTPVVGHDGTRKEYISQGDFTIGIQGVFTSGENEVFPQADVDALIKALSAPIPLEIVCPHLFRFGITKMVVTDYKIPQDEGVYSTQRITINAISHSPSYADVSQELANEYQDKNVVQSTLDKIANLSSTIDDQIASFSPS